MNRNTKGFILYFLITLVTTSLITFPLMIIRENYQYKKYLKPCNIGFEWNDVYQYGFAIGLAQVVQIMLLAVFGIIQ